MLWEGNILQAFVCPLGMGPGEVPPSLSERLGGFPSPDTDI